MNETVQGLCCSCKSIFPRCLNRGSTVRHLMGTFYDFMFYPHYLDITEKLMFKNILEKYNRQ
jgi:hypothetical protein